MLPDLTDQKVIAIDLETYDPNLKKKGAGHYRHDGRILGIAVGVPDGRRWYFPIDGRHYTARQLRRWCAKNLTTGATLVGANIMYDLAWLRSEGMAFKPPFFDVQFAEALIDEHARRYSLDSIADKYLGERKKGDALYDYCAKNFGGKPDQNQRANIYRAPIELVAEYAKGDVDLPLRIREKQLVIIKEQELGRVCSIEHRLIPLLLDMKFRGVRINEEHLHDCRIFFNKGVVIAQENLDEAAGFHVDVNIKSDLIRLFESIGQEYPTTAKGNPSFTKQFLESCPAEAAQLIVKVRGYAKMKSTFVDGYMSYLHEGRLHCDFHPLRSDEGGTVSGRFSSSRPNLQNIPSRDPVFAPMLRGLFIPDDGEKWAKIDYSSVEYRMLVHYAQGQGSNAVRDLFAKDPTTDFHQVVADMTGLTRKMAKGLNFSQLYGQGIRATAETLHCTVTEAKAFRTDYAKMAPYIQSTGAAIQAAAGSRGYLRGYLGRRHRFPFWEPSNWELSQELGRFRSREEAVEAVAGRGGVKRAQMHKAMNALFQGSSADIMKCAMVRLYEGGLLDVLGAPMLTVHDELDFSVPADGGMEAMQDVKAAMEDFPDLKVPLLAEIDMGDDWGHLE